MNNNAIVIYYSGNEPTESLIGSIARAVSAMCVVAIDDIVIKHFDGDAIVEAVGEKAIRTINFKDESHEKIPKSKIHIRIMDDKKLDVTKYVKNVLGISLKHAKEMVDAGILFIPDAIDPPDFAIKLMNAGAFITDTDSTYAISQAAYYINTKYNSADMVPLVKDYACAKYHSRVNTADQEEMALINAIEILQRNVEKITSMVPESIIVTLAQLKNM